VAVGRLHIVVEDSRDSLGKEKVAVVAVVAVGRIDCGSAEMEDKVDNWGKLVAVDAVDVVDAAGAADVVSFAYVVSFACAVDRMGIVGSGDMVGVVDAADTVDAVDAVGAVGTVGVDANSLLDKLGQFVTAIVSVTAGSIG